MPQTVDWTAERQLFKAVTDSSNIIAWATDPSGYCFYSSREFYAFTGLTEDLAAGFNWMSSVHPEDVVRVRKSFFDAHDTRQAYGAAFRLANADGQYIPIWGVGVPKISDDGEFTGFFGTACIIQTEMLALSPGAHSKSVLTPREREILTLISQGNTSDNVAAQLRISERTVNTHIARAGEKFGTFNRVHTVVTAVRRSEI